MRLQRDTYSCGVLAIVNAMRCYGRKIPERRIRAHSGTTYENGTNEDGMVAALEALGAKGVQFEVSTRTEAFSKIDEALAAGDPVIVCINNYQHWATVIGKLGDKYVVFDSSDASANVKENGVHIMTKNQLAGRWRSREATFFGISCKNRP